MLDSQGQKPVVENLVRQMPFQFSAPSLLLVSLVVVENRFFGIRAWNFSFTIAL